MSWENKTVLITGASSGIGEALAHIFAQKKANLVLLARREERLKLLAQKISSQSPVIYFPCDVTQRGSFENILPQILLQFKKIDVVIANAGFGVVGEIEKLSIEDFHRQFDTNVYGVIRTIQATLPELKKTKGRIAVVGSVNGYIALAGNSPYSMSKFAVRAFCDALRLEVAEYGVSVTHIAPGFVKSEIRKVSNLGEYREHKKDPIPDWLQMPAETAAKKIVCALGCRQKERVITAHGFWAVWLQSHFSWFVFWMMKIFRIRARGE